MTRVSRIALGTAAIVLAIAGSLRMREDAAPRSSARACEGIAAASPPSVWLADLTWEETCAAIAAGHRTVIVPTAGIEQNGRHAVLGKHRYVVSAASERIASELGQTLVAPVVDFVPEERHMGFAGTISVPERVFDDLLESIARSLRAHGFTLVAFVGDSLDNQPGQERVAAKLAKEWSGGALHVSDYYAKNGQVDFLKSRGETDASIGSHAGIRDTSELLAAHPDGVRGAKITATPDAASGSNGDASRASAALGEEMLRLKVAAAVAQIRRTK